MKVEFIRNGKGKELDRKDMIRISITEFLKADYEDILLVYNIMKTSVEAIGDFTREMFDTFIDKLNYNRKYIKACYIRCKSIEKTEDVFVDIVTEEKLTDSTEPFTSFLYWNKERNELGHHWL